MNNFSIDLRNGIAREHGFATAVFHFCIGGNRRQIFSPFSSPGNCHCRHVARKAEKKKEQQWRDKCIGRAEASQAFSHKEA